MPRLGPIRRRQAEKGMRPKRKEFRPRCMLQIHRQLGWSLRQTPADIVASDTYIRTKGYGLVTERERESAREREREREREHDRERQRR